MKRSPELRDLSEEHHYTLVRARHLRLAAEGKRPVPEALQAFLAEWDSGIERHFRAEEAVVLPAFAAATSPDHPHITRVREEHAALRDRVTEARSASGERLRELAGALGHGIDDHVRFEERVLFPAVEAALSPDALAELASELTRLHDGASRTCPRSGS